jgi:hypothetical protein
MWKHAELQHVSIFACLSSRKRTRTRQRSTTVASRPDIGVVFEAGLTHVDRRSECPSSSLHNPALRVQLKTSETRVLQCVEGLHVARWHALLCRVAARLYVPYNWCLQGPVTTSQSHESRLTTARGPVLSSLSSQNN